MITLLCLGAISNGLADNLPTVQWINTERCSNITSDTHRCLRLNFPDGIEKHALLSPSIGRSDGAFSGSIVNDSDAQVSLSTQRGKWIILIIKKKSPITAFEFDIKTNKSKPVESDEEEEDMVLVERNYKEFDDEEDMELEERNDKVLKETPLVVIYKKTKWPADGYNLWIEYYVDDSFRLFHQEVGYINAVYGVHDFVRSFLTNGDLGTVIYPYISGISNISGNFTATKEDLR